jgi:hypothetical protein
LCYAWLDMFILLPRIWVKKTNWDCWLYMQLYVLTSLKVTKGTSWCRYFISSFALFELWLMNHIMFAVVRHRLGTKPLVSLVRSMEALSTMGLHS